MLENANLNNVFLDSIIGDSHISPMILECLSLKEQSKAREVSRAVWLSVHNFWIAHDIYAPLHNNWTGAQMNFKILLCGANSSNFIHGTTSATKNQSCTVIPCGYNFTQSNIGYGFWSAPNINSRHGQLFDSYTQNTHIAVLCYKSAEDLDNLEITYKKILTASPNAKIIMACTNNDNVCKKKLAHFANGKKITYFCTITNSSELKLVINRFGFQIATEATVQQKQANTVKAIEPANCLVQ